MHKLFNLIEGGIIGAALLIIFDHIVQKINRRQPVYGTYYNYRPNYRPYFTQYRTKNDDEIIFDTYGDALSVLYKCIDDIDECGDCSISKFKNHVREITSKEVPRNYKDYKLGWKSLKDVKIKKNYKGFYIDFPVSEELD